MTIEQGLAKNIMGKLNTIWVQHINWSVWEKGSVVKKLNQRQSYLVSLDLDSEIIRRNSVNLKKMKENLKTTN